MTTVVNESLVACKSCGLIQSRQPLAPRTAATCARCGATVGEHRVINLDRMLAFSLAALILYVPANIFPILRMNLYGANSESTIWDGIVRLVRNGEWLVGTIVLCTSIVVPLLKLCGLIFLAVTARLRSCRWQRTRTWICRTIEVIGPWAMLDVFLLSILVALVNLKQLATILPGPGLLAFTAMVVLTILASTGFDPRLIWETLDAAP